MPDYDVYVKPPRAMTWAEWDREKHRLMPPAWALPKPKAAVPAKQPVFGQGKGRKAK
jgi:hypothetical protein